jgi:hypothetical protein
MLTRPAGPGDADRPAGPGDADRPGEDDLGQLVFDIARQLLHHTNFEGDYIYPELTHEEWRDLMKETVESVAMETPEPAAVPAGTEPAGNDGGSGPQFPAVGSVPTESSVNS